MRSPSVALFAVALAPSLLAQPAGLHNAKIRVVAAAAGRFSREMAELAASPAPLWIAWREPVTDRRQRMCCGDGPEESSTRSEGRADCGRCLLERDGSFSTKRTAGRVTALEDPEDFLLFARAGRGRVERLRDFSLDCEVDAGGMNVVWLEGVRAEESVAWLASLLPRAAPLRHPDPDSDADEGEETGRLASAAVGAIAWHAGPEAQATLERLLASGQDSRIRKKAAFWLAAARGQAGCGFLERAVPTDPDAAFRKHGTFALSLCRDAAAVQALVGMARRDAAAKVRGQALFWLAQRAGREAAAAIQDAIREDPDTEVKKRAVFALTQMPEAEGVSELIRVARTNRNPEVRRQAMFWLGQSKDPRALDFIEQVLTK